MKKVIHIILFAVCLPMLASCQKAESEIVVLPADFTGSVIIIFDQTNGKSIEYLEGARIYRIPNSGILKTQFSPNPGTMEFPKFYYKEISDGSRITYSPELDKLPSDQIIAYGGVTGGTNRDLAGKSVVRFLKYFIGTKDQVLKLHEESHKIDIIKLADD